MINRCRKGFSVSLLVVFFFTGIVFLADCRAEENPIRVTMETSMGTMVIELNQEKAPGTVTNFLQYVDDGFYEGTIFHRVIENFVIQGGGFDSSLNQKATRDPIQNESDNGLSNVAYTIAMARTTEPDSATSQFFINLKDNPGLDRSTQNAGYAVFGKVVDGTDVVDAIGAVETGTIEYFQDVPVETVLINSISRTTDTPDDGDDDGDQKKDKDSSDSTCFLNMIR